MEEIAVTRVRTPRTRCRRRPAHEPRERVEGDEQALSQMVGSMEVSGVQRKVSKIIKTIDEIAFQTKCSR